MLHIENKTESRKSTRRARRFAIAGGALAAVGVLALGIAVLLCARADATAEKDIEALNALTLADVRERLAVGAAAMKQLASLETDSAEANACALEALEAISAGKAMLAHVEEGAGATAGLLLEACRRDILDLINTKASAFDKSEEWERRLDVLGSVLGTPEADDILSSLCDELAFGGAEFGDRGYASFNTFSAMTDTALAEKAASYFGPHAVLNVTESGVFPPAMVMMGKNTYVALSRSRGELLELYFDRPPGEERLTEAECARIAVGFLADEKLPARLFSPALTVRDELCGAYYYNVIDENGRSICIGVRWDTGRIGFFNAYDFYR